MFGYCKCNVLQLRRKIKTAEDVAHNQYICCSHQQDSTGNVDEERTLLVVYLFFEYFDWKENIPSAINSQQQEANCRVERSLVGQ